jgi:tetratricopeptide (TPR) repeat protein
MYSGFGRPLLVACLLCRVASAYQGQADAEFTRAMQLAANGQFAEAEASLRTLEIAQPKIFEIRYRLGLILLRRDKPKEAATRFQSAIEIAPKSALAWVGLAQSRLKLSARPESLEAAARAGKLAPNEPAAWRALAIFYADAKDFSKAAGCEEKWSLASPGDSQSKARTAGFYISAGKAERAAKQPAKAVDFYQRAIRLVPDEPEPYFELAALLLDHRTPEPAVPVLDSAISRFPKDPEFRRLLGLAQYQLGNMPQAISAFLSVCDLDPDSEIGYASLETLLNDAGSRLPEIIKRFETFRSRKPASPVGHYLLARALFVQGAAASDKETLLRKAISAAADFWPAHYELGLLLEAGGKNNEALQALTAAVRINPQYAPAHFALARLYARTGDRTRTVEHRKIHSQLLAGQRTLAERARDESPALNYRLSGR